MRFRLQPTPDQEQALLVRVEDLKIKNMVRSARGTAEAPGTNVRANAGLNRADHADANAAKNTAVGRTVTARGGRPLGGPVNREPQPALSSA
jgi:hypothetical protein